MINIKADTIFQVEEYTPINKVLDRLSLEIDSPMVICPELFLQRFIQYKYNNDEIPESILSAIDHDLKHTNGYIDIDVMHKGKIFHFHFIILSSEIRVVSNPFKGQQLLNVGFKEIKTYNETV